MIAKTLTLTALLLSAQAQAQTMETSLNLDSQIMDYITKHFSGSYHGEIYGVRRSALGEDRNEKQIKDFKIMHNPTLVYKPIENWQVMATAEFKFSDQPAENAGADYPNGFYRSLLTVTRKNILTEKENGLKLDLGIGRRQFSTGAAQNAEGDYSLSSYGNNRIFSTLSKTMGTADTSLFVQYMHNDYKKSTASTWKHSVELIPSLSVPITANLSYFFNDDIIINTPKGEVDSALAITHEMNLAYLTYTWNDKISTYYQFKYIHSEGFSQAYQSQDDSLHHYTGVTYAFTPKQSLTFEVGSELAHARDGRDGLSKLANYPELALYIDLAI